MNRRMKCFMLGAFLGLATGSLILYTNANRGMAMRMAPDDLRSRAQRRLGRVEDRARSITNGTRTMRLVRFSG